MACLLLQIKVVILVIGGTLAGCGQKPESSNPDSASASDGDTSSTTDSEATTPGDETTPATDEAGNTVTTTEGGGATNAPDSGKPATNPTQNVDLNKKTIVVYTSNSGGVFNRKQGASTYSYPAYPAQHLEQQIRLAAELGVKMYRLNYTPETAESFCYLDRVVALCEQFGLRLFLVIFDRSFHGCDYPERIYESTKRIAARYKGRIAMYQISNEQDIATLDLVHYKDPIGDLPEQYDMEKYTDTRECFKAMIRGVKEGDPDAKTVINISWRHTGFLDMLSADGMEWDVNGLDWYYDLADHGGNNLVATLDHLCSLPQPEVIVAEANAWEGDYRFTEQEQMEYNQKAMEFYYRYPNKKLTGFILYELLDEPDKECGEAHFGLVLNDRLGNIGRPKLTYHAIRASLANTNSKE